MAHPPLAHRPTRPELAALAFVLALAAVLRVGWPGLSQFSLDEAHIASLALELATGQSLPLTGTRSSVGVHLPPMGNYLYALPFALWPSALGAVLFTGALNVVGVAACWWVGRRYWGPAGGLGSALLLALNPWAVAYSRQAWQPDLVAPLATMAVATGLPAFLEGRRWALAAHLTLLAATVLTHFSGAVLLPVTAGLALAYRRRARGREAAAGLAGAAVLAAPYGVHLVREREALVGLVAAATAQGARVDARALDLWWMTTTGGRIHALLGEAARGSWVMESPVVRVLPWAVLGLSLGALGYWLVRLAGGRLGRREAAALAVAGWYVAPLALFTRHSTPVHQHYMAVVTPAAALLGGSLLGEVVRRAGRPIRLGALGAFTGVAAGQAVVCAALLVSLGARATPGGFGSPLGQQLQAVRLARSHGGEVIVLSPGDNATHDAWAAVFGVHLWGSPHRLVDGRHAALLPAAPAALIATSGVEVALETYRLAGALGELRVVPGRPGEGSFHVGVVAPGALPALEGVPEPRLLSNGVVVLGYRVDGRVAPGEAIVWRVAWRIADGRYDPSRAYHIYSHLVDGDGRRWAQADGSTLPTPSWRVGDSVVQAFALEIPSEAPAGPYYVRVGMYTYPEMESQDVLDVAGNPAGQFVTLGPLG